MLTNLDTPEALAARLQQEVDAISRHEAEFDPLRRASEIVEPYRVPYLVFGLVIAAAGFFLQVPALTIFGVFMAIPILLPAFLAEQAMLLTGYDHWLRRRERRRLLQTAERTQKKLKVALKSH